MPANINNTPELTPRKLTRAESARLNGAKSKGPRTAAGLAKCRASSLTHGIYAVHAGSVPAGACEAYQALHRLIHDYWVPANEYQAAKVQDLVRYEWELERLERSRQAQLLRAFAEVSPGEPKTAVARALSRVSVPGGSYERHEQRITQILRKISQLENDLILCRNASPISEGTQMLLKTQNQTSDLTS